MATRGSNAAFIGTDQRIGIALARQCAGWIVRHHRSFRPNPGTTSRFTRRPNNSVMGEPYSHRIPAFSVKAELIRQSSVKKASYSESRKYLSALPNAMEAAEGTPSRKFRKIRSRHDSRCISFAGKAKRSPPVLLSQHIELLLLEVASKLEIVARTIPKERGGNSVGLVMVDGLFGIGEPLDAAEEDKIRRSPIQRSLIVAGNARDARDVLAIFEVRSEVHRKAAELIGESPKESLRETVKPGGVRGQPKAVGGIQETEDVGISLARVLKSEVAED